MKHKDVVIHIPYSLDDGVDRAPAIRPLNILKAFSDLGIRTHVISGSPHERKTLMRELKNKMRQNEIVPDLVYSESSSYPLCFSDGKRNHFHPFMDHNFLRFMKKHGAVVKLFYRDAYFHGARKTNTTFSRSIRDLVLSVFAKIDLLKYNSYLDVLYLPSLTMRRYLKEFKGVVEALPPGSAVQTQSREFDASSTLQLSYVGGIGNQYDLHDLCQAVTVSKSVNLTICTRDYDWEKVQNEYGSYLSDRIQVAHASYEDLPLLLDKADIGVLCLKPIGYLDFAVPVKLFDYIGRGLPVLASEGTFSGEFVKEYDVGWTVKAEPKKIAEELEKILKLKEKGHLSHISKKAKEVSRSHTWEARVAKIMDVEPAHLTSGGKNNSEKFGKVE